MKHGFDSRTGYQQKPSAIAGGFALSLHRKSKNHTYAVSIFLFLSFKLFSQDTIYKRNGDIINAKVLEVDLKVIKFKKASNPDGPLFTMSKSQITLIQYNDGSKDVFPQEYPPVIIKRSKSQDEVIPDYHDIGVPIESLIPW